jgi:mitochondrial fission protein ELM1
MISIWCVTDDKPGHKNQLRGLIGALERSKAVDCQWLSIHEKSRWPHVSETRGTEASGTETSSAPTLIIAAGSRTHWSALQLRWRYGGKLVVLMKPFLPLWMFDLCLIPQHDGVSPSKRVVTTRGALNPVPFSGQSDPNQGLILIGGPSSHYGWSDQEMVEQLLRLIQQQDYVRWTLTTSRRTPDSFLPALNTALAKVGEAAAIEIVPLEQTDGSWLLVHYRDCGVCWASEDSVSMVYESLSSGANTGILQVPRLGQNRVSKGLDQLIDEGRVMRLTADSAIKQQAPLREAEKAAQVIIERLL